MTEETTGSPVPPVNPPNGKRPPFRFTRENAREMLARARIAVKRNREAREASDAGEQLAAALQTTKDKTASLAFLSRRLARVRRQLCKLDRLIDEELDPSKLDRLASAQARLAEQERLLDDRSLPGSRRPGPVQGGQGIIRD